MKLIRKLSNLEMVTIIKIRILEFIAPFVKRINEDWELQVNAIQVIPRSSEFISSNWAWVRCEKNCHFNRFVYKISYTLHTNRHRIRFIHRLLIDWPERFEVKMITCIWCSTNSQLNGGLVSIGLIVVRPNRSTM